MILIRIHSSIKFESDNMENIFTAAKSFLILLRFLGLYSTESEGHSRKGIIRFQCFESILKICWSLAALTCLCLFSSTLGDMFYGKSKILDVAWFLLTILEVLSYVALVAYQHRKQQNISLMLKLLNGVDESVGFSIDEELALKFILIYRPSD